MKSALEANGWQKDLTVSLSNVDEAFCSEGPRNTPVQQGLIHLGLQHTAFQTKRGGWPKIQHRAETFEVCPQDTDLSVDCEREFSVFGENAA